MGLEIDVGGAKNDWHLARNHRCRLTDEKVQSVQTCRFYRAEKKKITRPKVFYGEASANISEDKEGRKN